MEVDDWLGVGCIIAGAMAFVVSLFTLYNLKNCKLNDHYKLDTALMWGSLFLSLGSFVPQLVRNESLKSEIDDSISLFVPIIGPLIILTRVPSTIDVLRKSLETETATVSTLSLANQLCVFVLFLVWISQYARYTERSGVSVLMWVALAVYIVAGGFSFVKIFEIARKKTHGESQTGVYMLFPVSETSETGL